MRPSFFALSDRVEKDALRKRENYAIMPLA